MQVNRIKGKRSDCPVSFALDIFGDKWTFLIIRDLMQGKQFYKEFLASEEKIATNILSDRLKRLEAHDIIESKVYEKQRTQKVYSLTEKGQDLIPIVIDLIVWSDKYEKGLKVTRDFVSKASADRDNLIDNIRKQLQLVYHFPKR